MAWAIFLAVCSAAVFMGAGTARAAGCPNADISATTPDQITTAEAATRCLINVERKKRGLKSVRFNKDLQQSADWQANDMLQFKYFAHERDGGPGFVGRITRFGYASGGGGYMLGENIAWSTSDGASPREMVSMWMHSPPHKANILNRKFKEQAISAVYSPAGIGGDYDVDAPFLVYVNQFGTRF